MKDSLYLYETEGKVFAKMMYLSALYYKKAKAKVLLSKLQSVPFFERDEKRINAVYKAINFNAKLIEECEK